MDSNTKKTIEQINENLKKIKDKSFNVYFFVPDSRNIPSGSMSYIYQMAKELKSLDYKVTMLYKIENEYTKEEIEKLIRENKQADQNRYFVGVEGWLGEEYEGLVHKNIDNKKEEIQISPSDILFIPDTLTTVIADTRKLPCKRVIICQNVNYIPDFIPVGVSWEMYDVKDCLFPTESQLTQYKEYFPFLDGKVLSPALNPLFRKGNTQKELLVTVIARTPLEAKKVINPFFWKYKIYNFITFKTLSGLPKKEFASFLRKSFVTVWIDEESQFGYAALEAIKSGNVVIGKIPDHAPEWITEDDNTTLRNCAVWFTDYKQCHELLLNVIETFLKDLMPEKIYEEMGKVVEMYGYDKYKENVKSIMSEYEDQNKKRMELFLEQITPKEETKTEEEA